MDYSLLVGLHDPAIEATGDDRVGSQDSRKQSNGSVQEEKVPKFLDKKSLPLG